MQFLQSKLSERTVIQKLHSPAVIEKVTQNGYSTGGYSIHTAHTIGTTVRPFSFGLLATFCDNRLVHNANGRWSGSINPFRGQSTRKNILCEEEDKIECEGCPGN